LNVNKKGLLIVISGPAGCGKDTIIEGLLKDCPDICYSVSATTRKIRDGEQDGKHYLFKTREEFEELLKRNELLEYTEYCNNYYGTLKETVTVALDNDKKIVLKIEVEGAANVKKIFPDCVSIFILPPSLDELRRRLENRATEKECVIDMRIKKAEMELARSDDYDYLVTNDDLQTAIDEVADIIRKEKSK